MVVRIEIKVALVRMLAFMEALVAAAIKKKLKWTDSSHKTPQETYRKMEGHRFTIRVRSEMLIPDAGDFEGGAGHESRCIYIRKVFNEDEVRVISAEDIEELAADRVKDLCLIFNQMCEGSMNVRKCVGLPGIREFLAARIPPWYTNHANELIEDAKAQRSHASELEVLAMQSLIDYTMQEFDRSGVRLLRAKVIALLSNTFDITIPEAAQQEIAIGAAKDQAEQNLMEGEDEEGEDGCSTGTAKPGGGIEEQYTLLDTFARVPATSAGSSGASSTSATSKAAAKPKGKPKYVKIDWDGE